MTGLEQWNQAADADDLRIRKHLQQLPIAVRSRRAVVGMDNGCKADVEPGVPHALGIAQGAAPAVRIDPVRLRRIKGEIQNRPDVRPESLIQFKHMRSVEFLLSQALKAKATGVEEDTPLEGQHFAKSVRAKRAIEARLRQNLSCAQAYTLAAGYMLPDVERTFEVVPQPDKRRSPGLRKWCPLIQECGAHFVRR